MLHKLCNFSPIFSFLYADLAIPEKCHLKLYLQSFKQWILELSNLYLISQVNPIWTYFRNRLVPSDICFSTQFSVFQYFRNSTSTTLRRKQLTLLQSSETYIIFLCLLSAINYRPVSIDISVQLQSINDTVTNIICFYLCIQPIFAVVLFLIYF